MPKITTEKTIKRHKNIRLNKEDEEIIKNHMLSSGKKPSVQAFFDEKIQEIKITNKK